VDQAKEYFRTASPSQRDYYMACHDLHYLFWTWYLGSKQESASTMGCISRNATRWLHASRAFAETKYPEDMFHERHSTKALERQLVQEEVLRAFDALHNKV
jgi:hypothetical protein